MINIEFTEKFDAIICLDGILPPSEFFDNFKNIPVFAADGAVIKLLNMQIDYQKVIGDLDTIIKYGYREKIPDSKIVYLPDQESNDFEKTLNYIEQLDLKRVLITGFHGGELEHSLNNWSVLMKYMTKMKLCIYENGRYSLPSQESFTLPTTEGELVGLLPQPKAILTTSGFKWELKNELLGLGIREGARNIAMGQQVVVEIIEGSILCFIDSRLPYAPNN